MAQRMSIMILLICGVTILFYFGGLIGAEDNALIALLLNPQDISSSVLWSNVVNLVAGGLFAVVIGFATKDLRTSIMAGVVVFLWQFLFNIIQVYAIVFTEAPVIAILIFSPAIILMFYTLFIDVVGGT